MKRTEITFFAVLIAAVNLPLLFGGVSQSLIFMPDNVMAGQLWRVVTHPFVHVSFYHLIIDGLAFFMLYSRLDETSSARRVMYFAASGLGSMTAAGLVMGGLDSVGYCGLSGVAHGLMAVCALEMICTKTGDRTLKTIGFVYVGFLAVKCLYEAVAGNVLFGSLHFGSIGSPVAIAHLGGLLGGVIMFLVFNINTESFAGGRYASVAAR